MGKKKNKKRSGIDHKKEETPVIKKACMISDIAQILNILHYDVERIRTTEITFECSDGSFRPYKDMNWNESSGDIIQQIHTIWYGKGSQKQILWSKLHQIDLLHQQSQNVCPLVQHQNFQPLKVYAVLYIQSIDITTIVSKIDEWMNPKAEKLLQDSFPHVPLFEVSLRTQKESDLFFYLLKQISSPTLDQMQKLEFNKVNYVEEDQRWELAPSSASKKHLEAFRCYLSQLLTKYEIPLVLTPYLHIPLIKGLSMNEKEGSKSSFMSQLRSACRHFSTDFHVLHTCVDSPELKNVIQISQIRRLKQARDSTFERNRSALEEHLFDTPSKIVIICRGIPGSGKSTVNRAISQLAAEKRLSCRICSADRYFETASGYNFNRSKISDAHKFCQQSFREAIQDGIDVVIVDNTNTQRWEYEVYEKELAEALPHQYALKVMEIGCPDNWTATLFGIRNNHQVPPKHVLRMFERFERDDRAFVISPYFNVPAALVHKSPRLSCYPNARIICVYLTEESKTYLKNAIQPVHSNVIYDHVTIQIHPSRRFVEVLPIGEYVQIRVVGVATDSKAQAALIEVITPVGLVSSNTHAHITLSVAPGVPSVYSNELLSTQAIEPTQREVIVDGLLGISASSGGPRRPFVYPPVTYAAYESDLRNDTIVLFDLRQVTEEHFIWFIERFQIEYGKSGILTIVLSSNKNARDKFLALVDVEAENSEFLQLEDVDEDTSLTSESLLAKHVTKTTTIHAVRVYSFSLRDYELSMNYLRDYLSAFSIEVWLDRRKRHQPLALVKPSTEYHRVIQHCKRLVRKVFQKDKTLFADISLPDISLSSYRHHAVIIQATCRPAAVKSNMNIKHSFQSFVKELQSQKGVFHFYADTQKHSVRFLQFTQDVRAIEFEVHVSKGEKSAGPSTHLKQNVGAPAWCDALGVVHKFLENRCFISLVGSILPGLLPDTSDDFYPFFLHQQMSTLLKELCQNRHMLRVTSDQHASLLQQECEKAITLINEYSTKRTDEPWWITLLRPHSRIPSCVKVVLELRWSDVSESGSVLWSERQHLLHALEQTSMHLKSKGLGIFWRYPTMTAWIQKDGISIFEERLRSHFQSTKVALRLFRYWEENSQ